jgi:hypothetical protein
VIGRRKNVVVADAKQKPQLLLGLLPVKISQPRGWKITNSSQLITETELTMQVAPPLVLFVKLIITFTSHEKLCIITSLLSFLLGFN